jgi:DNA-binding MarR family transcriptional regulator
MVDLYESFIVCARNWSNEWNLSNQIGLSPSHVLILELLELEAKKRPSKLSEELQITTGGITGLTNKLVKDGFIKRSHLEDDRRAIALEITEEGKAILQKARVQKLQQMNKMFGMLSDLELSTLITIFHKMNDTLGDKEKSLEQ